MYFYFVNILSLLSRYINCVCFKRLLSFFRYLQSIFLNGGESLLRISITVQQFHDIKNLYYLKTVIPVSGQVMIKYLFCKKEFLNILKTNIQERTMKLIINFFLIAGFSASLFAQNITNTLGTLGVFTIKDGSTNYFTLSQSTGQVNILNTLRLENTTNSTTGIIFKGIDRFIHNYGTNNTFLGINSGNFTMTGNSNTALGFMSLFSNTTGSINTALGYQSLTSNTTGSYNTAVGYQSLYSNTGGYFNTALGIYSLYTNTTGSSNTALGLNSLYSNTTGYQNTAVGYESLYSNTTGFINTAVGVSSLHNNTTGIYNTAVGNQSLYNNTSGDSNTALGYSTGSTIRTGNNLTCIGFNAEPTSVAASNQITLGNSSITSLRCNVTTITSLSDMRDKKNITDLSLGLDFITKLKPRVFNWDKREWYDDNTSDGTKMQEAPTAGFIAQELDEAQTTENAQWLNLVLKDNPEKWEATPGNLLPIMVKAIQDLNLKCEELKKENEQLKVVNEKLAKLEQLINELTAVKHASLTEDK